MRKIKLLAVLVLSYSLMGCSASLPLSEVYIFNKDETIKDPLYPRTDTLQWKSTKGGLVSANNNAGEINRYLVENFEAQETHNLNKLGVGYASATNADIMAFGYNFGYNAMGINATFGIGLGNFITLNGSLNEWEAILQRRILYRSTNESLGGITLGAFAKKEYYAYKKDDNTAIGLFKDIYHINNRAPIDLYGGRSMFHWRFLYDVMIHGFVSYGYSPQLDDGILEVGVVFGMDHFE